MIDAFTHCFRPNLVRASLVALLAVLAGTSCDNSDPTEPTSAGTSGEAPGVNVATDSAAPTSLVPAFATSYSGIAFGPTGLWDNYKDLNWGPAMFTGSQVPVDAGGIVTLLNSARDKNQRLVLAMTGGPSTNYTTGGKFDMTKWKRKMSTFNTATIRNAVAAAVSGGTIVGNSMIDEPETVRWGGNITKATIDAMATYAKSIFPTLPFGINIGPPAYKWRSTERYQKLDWVRYQYNWFISTGNVAAWRDAVLAQARSDGVTPAFSINLLDGGIKDKTGSWDCPGTGKGTYAPNCRMTADQVRSWGRTLASAGGCFMYMWRYDDLFISKTANQDAFRDVASVTNSVSRRSCRRP